MQILLVEVDACARLSIKSDLECNSSNTVFEFASLGEAIDVLTKCIRRNNLSTLTIDLMIIDSSSSPEFVERLRKIVTVRRLWVTYAIIDEIHKWNGKPMEIACPDFFSPKKDLEVEVEKLRRRCAYHLTGYSITSTRSDSGREPFANAS